MFLSQSDALYTIDGVGTWLSTQWSQHCVNIGKIPNSQRYVDVHSIDILKLGIDYSTLFQLVIIKQQLNVDISIQDNTIQFKGNWTDPVLSLKSLKSFKPWNSPKIDNRNELIEFINKTVLRSTINTVTTEEILDALNSAGLEIVQKTTGKKLD